MEKQEYSQLDLFNKAGDSEGAAQRLSGTFLSYIRTYERLVLMLIGLVVTGVVCFCVGVEKGKHLAFNQFNSNLDIAYHRNITPRVNMGSAVPVPPRSAASAMQLPQQPIVPAMKQPVKSAPVELYQPVTMAKTTQQPVSGVYTIQIGSYEGTTYAQQEISTLKKQGLLPVI